MSRLTVREACELTAFTGVLLVPVGVFHVWAERALGRPILTYELGTHEVTNELKEHARPLIWAILPTLGEGGDIGD